MRKQVVYGLLLGLLVTFTSCKKEIRNIAESTANPTDPTVPVQVSTDVNPVDINVDGFGLLENMQGHWVGQNMVIADQFDWFAFDYRAISPSQVHGIFEGGTMGNLFTSFFVTDFMNTRTIMARNGGVLNGIYRTSYFVMDSVDHSNGDYYRLVDAKNGTAIMFMELRFKNDSLYFNAYTSRMGEFLPSLHMSFQGKKEHPALAQAAAQAIGFPQNTPAWDFSNGFNESYFYQNPNSQYQTASFLAQDNNLDVYALAPLSGDPFTITDHPYLGTLQLDVVRNAMIDNTNLFVNLSIDPLTDASGYMTNLAAFNTILTFPELIGTQDQFLFTYLHPGDYYITVIADTNGDGFPGQGDVTHVSQQVTITPEQNQQITIDNINVQN